MEVLKTDPNQILERPLRMRFLSTEDVLYIAKCTMYNQQ
jgi:hypothetical protein